MVIRCTSKPEQLAVSIDDMRDYLRLGDDDSHDDKLIGFIAARALWLESRLGRAFVNQTWTANFDRAELSIEDPELYDERADATKLFLRLPILNAKSTGVAVRAWNTSHALTTLTSGQFTVILEDEQATIEIDGSALPTPLRKFQCLEIELPAGLGANDSVVPDDIKRAIKRLVAADFEWPAVDIVKVETEALAQAQGEHGRLRW